MCSHQSHACSVLSHPRPTQRPALHAVDRIAHSPVHRVIPNPPHRLQFRYKYRLLSRSSPHLEQAGETGAEQRLRRARLQRRGRRRRAVCREGVLSGGRGRGVGAALLLEREDQPRELRRQILSERVALALQLGGGRRERAEVTRGGARLLLIAAINDQIVQGVLHQHVLVGGAADTEVVTVCRLDELLSAWLHAAHIGPADELLTRTVVPIEIDGRAELVAESNWVGNGPAGAHEGWLLAVDKLWLRTIALANWDGAHPVLEHETTVANVPRADGACTPHLAMHSHVRSPHSGRYNAAGFLVALSRDHQHLHSPFGHVADPEVFGAKREDGLTLEDSGAVAHAVAEARAGRGRARSP
mmetsp:Transcript_264/g.591  ORF Transcript_264/g.591 Transcript_264/m.591 type:complete len:358 (-) Transcript_264:26-1099(-)